MMPGTMSYYFVLYGSTLFGIVLSHAVNNGYKYETTKEMNDKQGVHCNNYCPYGYVPDVEGELTCACFDPCSMLLCRPGYMCTARMPEECAWGTCRPETRCEVDFMKRKKHDNLRPPNDAPGIPYDFWDTSRENDVSVCSEPLPAKAFKCRHKRRRWFYNVITGKCERYEGCSAGRNSFTRKRICKNTCKGHVIPPEELKLIVPDDKACAQQPSYKDFHSCDPQHRRWFYNDNTGRCEKFTGCIGTGNNFSRKVFCKAKCKNMITKFRRSRTAGFHLKDERST